MNRDDLARFKKWFADYVAGYYADDPARNHMIRLKQEHTIQVCREINMLGQALQLAAQDMFLAETMALFHDIGRFEQYAAYGTFKDTISENHAELGLHELARHEVLSICPEAEQLLITKVIRYHNVRTLPEYEDQRSLFFARLLRDADKLDIWRVFIDYYERKDKEQNSIIVLGLPNKEACSPNVIDTLRQKKMGDTRDMATLNDYKLVQISWVFDLNFQPTFRAVHERRYVERIAAVLPQAGEIQELVAIVQEYIDEQLAGSDHA